MVTIRAVAVMKPLLPVGKNGCQFAVLNRLLNTNVRTTAAATTTMITVM